MTHTSHTHIYRKQQKLRERKVLWLNGICHYIGKTFALLLTKVIYLPKNFIRSCRETISIVNTILIYVTGPEKTGLIYTKYTYLYYGAYLFFCVRYAISVNCIEFLRILCINDEICDEMLCCQVEILHLKD